MKTKNLFMSATLMCGLLIFAFAFDNEGTKWLWSETKPVAIVLGMAAVILGILY
ncbi:MAG: hypothetical protein KF860_03680 [Cyclobacteriaceae bacterium]|nr:hypothetical protein [Cyclobacteriaceae bacterium]